MMVEKILPVEFPSARVILRVEHKSLDRSKLAEAPCDGELLRANPASNARGEQPVLTAESPERLRVAPEDFCAIRRAEERKLFADQVNFLGQCRPTVARAPDTCVMPSSKR